MLPYQAVAMDYVASGFHHHQRAGGLPVMGLPGPGPGLNPGLNTAFTHSWFVQTSPDICRQQQASNQSHLEPGHVSFFSFLYFNFLVIVVLLLATTNLLISNKDNITMVNFPEINLHNNNYFLKISVLATLVLINK